MPLAILEMIFAARKERVAQAQIARPLELLKEEAVAMPPTRDFAAALLARPPAIIAEIKKGSPSKGVFGGLFDPMELARKYESGGAAALSIVTEPDFFLGSLNWVKEIRAEVRLPILRKDFVFSEYQVWESRAAGADAILLILAMLKDEEAANLIEEAKAAGLQCLVEVHDEEETRRACKLEAPMIGVNNRDLKTFDVTLETSERLAPLLSGSAVRVAESGIFTGADCQRLSQAGFGAFLVGEALVTAPDPVVLLHSLRGADAAH